MKEKNSSPASFEKAYARLEEILEKMNSETVSLEDALKFYEEADQLILSCNQKLLDAEQKIETLVKNRSGELLLDESGKPLLEPFTPATQSALSKYD